MNRLSMLDSSVNIEVILLLALECELYSDVFWEFISMLVATEASAPPLALYFVL